MNGKGDDYRISKDTQADIRKAAQDFNFTPNQTARGLRLQKSFTIGLVIPDISNPFFSTIARALKNECRKSGYSIILCDSEDQTALENNVKFSFTDYNFSELIAVCEKLTRQLVQKYDGKIVNKNGQEYFLIPQKNLLINKSEKCWEVEEVTDDYQYSEEEMTQITVKAPQINEFVKEWKICGPFIKESIETKDLIHHEFLPENSQIEWRKIILGEDGQNKTNLVFHDIFGGENRVAYAKTNIKSNKLQKGYLLLGSDDGVKIWQNGEQIFENNVFRGCNIMDEKIDIKLLKGDNEFLFKVIQGTGGWELTAVVTDENGKV